MTTSLVSCEWLKEKIDSGNLGDVVILDVSWSSAKDAYEDYKGKHILNARYINILDAVHNDILIRNLPTAEHFTELAQNAGVNKTSHVVVYSSSDRAGFFLAGRGWWTFRVFGFTNVSILDGGLTKWEQLGYPTTADLPSVTRGNFQADSSKSVYKHYEDVAKNTKSKDFQVVDTRSTDQYAANHIPGAMNVVMANLVDQSNGTLKSKEGLQTEFSNAGVDLKQPVTVHCNGGMSSCTVAFAAELLGQTDVAVFHGGFTEWKKRQATD